LKELNIRGIEQQESDIFFTQKGSVDAESQSNPESYLDAQTESQAGIQPESTKPLNQTQRRRKIKITARSISTISQEDPKESPVNGQQENLDFSLSLETEEHSLHSRSNTHNTTNGEDKTASIEESTNGQCVNLSDSNLDPSPSTAHLGISENDSCAENSFKSDNGECAENNIINENESCAKTDIINDYEWSNDARGNFPNSCSENKNKLKDNNFEGQPGNNCETLNDAISLPFSKEESEENKPEVKLRQRKYSRRRSTASYRWSGVEMTQIDGPAPATELTLPADTNTPVNLQTKAVDLESLKSDLISTVSRYGLTLPPEDKETKCSDSCLVALLDQMSRSGDDFKVWDKDDHTFLRWYITRQMDIQIGTGKASEFLNLEPDNHQQQINNQFQTENSATDEYFLRAFSRIFNRDVVIVSPGRTDHFRGGIKNKPGKGRPLIFGLLQDDSATNKVFTSLVPEESADLDTIIQSLTNIKT